MLPSLEMILAKHAEAANALAEHFAEKNDDKAFALFDEVLEYQLMFMRFLNDAWRERLHGERT